MLPPTFTGCVTLNKLLKLSDLQFNHLYKGRLVKLSDYQEGLNNIFMLES